MEAEEKEQLIDYFYEMHFLAVVLIRHLHVHLKQEFSYYHSRLDLVHQQLIHVHYVQFSSLQDYFLTLVMLTFCVHVNVEFLHLFSSLFLQFDVDFPVMAVQDEVHLILSQFHLNYVLFLFFLFFFFGIILFC